MLWSTAIGAVLLLSAAAAQDGHMDYKAMEKALEKAQADAVRPGDETLECDGLENELITVVKAPAVQAYMTKWGEHAKKDQERMNAAAAAAPIQSAVTAFASLVPGGDWAAIMAARSQAPAQRAETQKNLQARMQQGIEMMEIMPQIFRGQRVIELAQKKDCTWMSQADLEGDQIEPQASPKEN